MEINNFEDVIETQETINEYRSLNEEEKLDVDRNVFLQYLHSLLNVHDRLDTKEIDASKGDISKLRGIGTMASTKEVLVFNKLRKIYADSKKKPDAYTMDMVRSLETLTLNLVKHKKEFTKSYQVQDKMGMVIYTDAVMAIVMGARMLVSYTVTMENGKSSFRGNLPNTKASKTVLNTVNKLNSSIFENGMIKKLNESFTDDITLHEFLGLGGAFLAATKTVGSAALILGVIVSLFFLLKKLVWLFFHIKNGISEYFSDLAEFTEDHYHTLDPIKDKKIIENQKKKSEIMYSWARKLEIKDHNIDKKVRGDVAKGTLEIQNNISKVTATTKINSDVESNGFIF